MRWVWIICGCLWLIAAIPIPRSWADDTKSTGHSDDTFHPDLSDEGLVFLPYVGVMLGSHGSMLKDSTQSDVGRVPDNTQRVYGFPSIAIHAAALQVPLWKGGYFVLRPEFSVSRRKTAFDKEALGQLQTVHLGGHLMFQLSHRLGSYVRARGIFGGHIEHISDAVRVNLDPSPGEADAALVDSRAGDAQNYDSMNYGLTFGVGVDLFRYVTLDLRYQLGNADIRSDDVIEHNVRALSVMVGVQFYRDTAREKRNILTDDSGDPAGGSPGSAPDELPPPAPTDDEDDPEDNPEATPPDRNDESTSSVDQPSKQDFCPGQDEDKKGPFQDDGCPNYNALRPRAWVIKDYWDKVIITSEARESFLQSLPTYLAEQKTDFITFDIYATGSNKRIERLQDELLEHLSSKQYRQAWATQTLRNEFEVLAQKEQNAKANEKQGLKRERKKLENRRNELTKDKKNQWKKKFIVNFCKLEDLRTHLKAQDPSFTNDLDKEIRDEKLRENEVITIRVHASKADATTNLCKSLEVKKAAPPTPASPASGNRSAQPKVGSF